MKDTTQALQNALNHVTLHPREWNQAMWGVIEREVGSNEVAVMSHTGCGTSACLAGTGLVQNGWSMLMVSGRGAYAAVPNDRLENALDELRETIKLHGGIGSMSVAAHIAAASDIREVGQELFGLADDPQLAEALFGEGNRLLDLWTIACAMVPGLTAPEYIPANRGEDAYVGHEAVLRGMADRVDAYLAAYNEGDEDISLPSGEVINNYELMGVMVDSGTEPWEAFRDACRTEADQVAAAIG